MRDSESSPVTGRPHTADRPDPAADPGRGRRLGIDVGSVRIGVASSDPDGILATPVETVARAARKGPATDIARIAEIVREYEAVEVVVGLPRTLRGEKGSSAEAAIAFARGARAPARRSLRWRGETRQRAGLQVPARRSRRRAGPAVPARR
ncbi:Holliday junction resolvase RuvX, partial [Nocardia puris]|nr:Holliday junction resolvase RuvX [Nocardia puris]